MNFSLPFFYEPDWKKQTERHTLRSDSHKHAVQVLRIKTGERIHLTNGKGLLGTAVVEIADKKNAIVRIEEEKTLPHHPKQIILAVSPLKNPSRFEWMLEKLTELGISQIQPIICERTEKTFFKPERFEKILVAAMLQSQQAYLPILHVPQQLKELNWDTKDAWIAHCLAGEKQELSFASQSHQSTIIFIGPEGDFTEDEIRYIQDKGGKPLSLGNLRLRTETAAIKAAAFFSHSY